MVDLADLVSKRSDILAVLSATSRTKPELVRSTDASRSTVDRAIEELESAGLITREDSRYRATTTAKNLSEVHQSYCSTLETYYEARDVLDTLPHGVDVDAVVFEGASISVAHPRLPNQTLRENLEVARRADSITSTTPVHLQPYGELFAELVLESEFELETVYHPSVLQGYSAECRETLNRMLDSGLTAYERSDLPHYALWTAECPRERTCGLITYTETGVKASVINRNSAAVEWVARKLDEIIAGATKVTSVADSEPPIT